VLECCRILSVLLASASLRVRLKSSGLRATIETHACPVVFRDRNYGGGGGGGQQGYGGGGRGEPETQLHLNADPDSLLPDYIGVMNTLVLLLKGALCTELLASSHSLYSASCLHYCSLLDRPADQGG
jgi:hypothetical protein